MSLHFGYLDPGTGSLFIQAVIGALVGGAFVFRSFLARIAMRLRGRGKRVSPAKKMAPDDASD